jgi:hypothetical protein
MKLEKTKVSKGEISSCGMNYQEILKQAIDLHVHIGPEIIPRKFTLSGLIASESGRLGGVGVKNHFFPTISMGELIEQDKDNFIIINSVVLNRYVGGFNPDIVKASAELSERPIIVWFPTLHTEKFLLSQETEIPKEWIDPRLCEKVKLRQSKDVKPLDILDSKGEIIAEVKKVLNVIEKQDAILATGHLSWQDSYKLVKFASNELGIKKIIITHPIYQKIDMPISIQKELAQLGAIIEHCYSMHSIDKIPIRKIAEQIKEVGADNCILSSDVGQVFSKSPSESLADFISLLLDAGITENEIKIMLVTNPRKLVFGD